MALEALKNGDMAQLSECVDSDTLDLDATYPEAGHTTLLQTALQLGNHRAVVLLLARGAEPHRYNTVLKLAPLHVALGAGSKASQQTLELLVRALDPEALEARDWSGQTALHLAALRGEEGVKILQVLLTRGAGVNTRDSRGGHTALDMASLAGCWKAVERLASAGGLASPDTLKHLETKMPNTAKSLGLRKALEQPLRSSAAVAEALLSQLPSDFSDGVSKEWEQLLNTASPSDLDISTGVQSLVQAAADRGLVRHLELLLKAGASPNTTTPSSPASPLLLAARAGNLKVFSLLIRNKDTALDDLDEDLKQNVLLTVLHQPLADLGLSPAPDYCGCLEVLLPVVESLKDKARCRALVNQQDTLGNSALHYATQSWPQGVVTTILKLGANIGLTNFKGESAISGILPHTMEDFLNSDCLTSNDKNPTNENFAITFNYSFLAPPLHLAPHSQGEVPECCPLLPCAYNDQKKRAREEESRPMLETDVLMEMARSADHRVHLKHPVVTSFLALKWSRISIWYNINILFVFFFVAILTSYIFSNYGGSSLNITLPVCMSDLNVTTNVTQTKPYGNASILWAFLTLFLIIMIGREVIQFMVAPLKHLKSFENMLEIVLIVLVSVLIFHSEPGCHAGMKREISAAVLLLSWMELLTMLGRHPTWHRCNIYSTMFFTVLTTFITFLVWYSLFLVAFGLGFFILLHGESQGIPQSDDDEPKFFNHLGLAVVKTFSMFVGELEFSSIPFQVSPGFSYIFFLIFVFLMVVVLMNLLNGLAVSE